MELHGIMRHDLCELINRCYGLVLLFVFEFAFRSILTEFYDHYLINASANVIDKIGGTILAFYHFFAISGLILAINNFKTQLDCFGVSYHQMEINQNLERKNQTTIDVSR